MKSNGLYHINIRPLYSNDQIVIRVLDDDRRGDFYVQRIIIYEKGKAMGKRVSWKMKPWVEWLLSIALLLLVVTVIVALVIGFVRWRARRMETNKYGTNDDDDDRSAGLHFDLGTPDQSTLLRRRQIRRQPTRRYLGTSTYGEMYKLSVHPLLKTIDHLNLTKAVQGTISFTTVNAATTHVYTPTQGNAFTSIVEIPGEGLLLGKVDGEMIVGLPEESDKEQFVGGQFVYTQFSKTAETISVGLAELDKNRVLHQKSLNRLGQVQFETQVHCTGENQNQIRVLCSSATDMLAVNVPNEGSIVMLPQTSNPDLPFPLRARYHALIGSTEAVVDIQSADGAITIQNKKEDRTMFTGKLTSLSHGIFIARTDQEKEDLEQKDYLFAQFVDQWCLISGHFQSKHLHAIGLISNQF